MKHKAPDTIELQIMQNEATTRGGIRKLAYQPVAGDDPGMSIEEYVRYTIKGYDEAYAEAGDLPEEDRRYVAQMSWRCLLPIMDTPNSAKAFIACIAVGHARGWLKPEDARGLSYTAQLALAALKGGR